MAGWRKRRRAYLDDYKINEEGEYEYQGSRYQWTLDETERQLLLRQFRAMGIIAVAASLLAGCIPAPGVNHSAYLVLPYSIGVVAAISLCMAVWRMCGEKNPMREHVYEASVKKIPFRGMLSILLAAISMVGEVIYLFTHGSGGMLLYGIIFLLLEAVALIIAVYIRQKVMSLEWKKLL